MGFPAPAPPPPKAPKEMTLGEIFTELLTDFNLEDYHYNIRERGKDDERFGEIVAQGRALVRFTEWLQR